MSMLTAAALLVGVLAASVPTAVQSIGVCYGTHGTGLPSAADVVQLYRSNGIAGMRIYSPDTTILGALRGSGIAVIVDATNLDALVADAPGWVQANVLPYKDDVSFKYIAVGNEVEGANTHKILPDMQSLSDALSVAGLGGSIKVSTFLAGNGSPLLANIYPYFAYRDANGAIDLNFALFQPSNTVVHDDGGRDYTNLFDAMADAMYSAMEKEGGSGVPIVVSESGWPSGGGSTGGAETVENARTYNQNLINHVGNGTPKRSAPLETYIFAMFNENQKTGDETEKHFGLFNGSDKSPVYPISF
ncbi:hypothetical protein BS78_K217800 [Paspalum vaginatum]|uniref:Uncharacterized protein n=1 Tax=Paspalum vaginatum TaxID=158149 RepID=A0A9W7X8T9_9POAL|nr:hypothetical protein BS78_K217800 [Paspalum vaginatum]